MFKLVSFNLKTIILYFISLFYCCTSALIPAGNSKRLNIIVYQVPQIPSFQKPVTSNYNLEVKLINKTIKIKKKDTDSIIDSKLNKIPKNFIINISDTVNTINENILCYHDIYLNNYFICSTPEYYRADGEKIYFDLQSDNYLLNITRHCQLPNSTNYITLENKYQVPESFVLIKTNQTTIYNIHYSDTMKQQSIDIKYE